MVSHKTEIRVRYADTDQMHFVYNGKYLEYFEVGRTEMFRQHGLAYSIVESKGYQLPLLEANVKYLNPAYYDDILVIESYMKELPSFRIHIDYNIFRKIDGSLIAEGFTEHVFIKSDTKKPSRLPSFVVEALKSYY
jgi:acyl-CoA thioester hydrolase